MKPLILITLLLLTTGCFKRKHLEKILSYGPDSNETVQVCRLEENSKFCRNFDINYNSFAVTHYHTEGKDRVILYHNCVQNTSKFFMGVEKDDWDNFEDYIADLEPNLRDQAFKDFIFENLERFGPLTPQDEGKYFTYRDNVDDIIFSENQASFKDLEAMGAQLELTNSEELSERLTADYGLSTDRAQSVAKTIHAYKKITTKRSLTSKEQDRFSRNLLGVNFQKVTDSFTSGEGMNDLLEQAADINGTSPEQISAIINEVFL